MMNNPIKFLAALSLMSLLVMPSYGRGFGGGGFRGGGFSGGEMGGCRSGGFGGGGFRGGEMGGSRAGEFGGGNLNRSEAGGFNRAGMGGYDRGATGGFNRGFEGNTALNRGGEHMGEGGFSRSDYGGGGFNSIAGSKPAMGGESAMSGRSNFNQFTGHNPSQLATDGGLGSVAGRQTQFSGQHGNAQRANVGNSFNRNTNINNFNRSNISTGYHPNYGAYGDHRYGGAYGYHPYGGYGYHPYYGGFCGYPGAWCGAGLTAASMWTCMGVSTLTSFLGIAALNNSRRASSNNVTYEGDNVYIGGQPAQQYYQQGQQLTATAGPNTVATQQNQDVGGIGSTPLSQQIAYNPSGESQIPSAASTAGGTGEQWQPLGVYALVEPGQTQSSTLFQLAINKDGIVRGNYLNQITNERSQLHGALDKSTQQISWSVGDNPDTVFGTTLSELMKEDSKVVVQFGPANTQQMSLIRQKPSDEANPQSSPGQTG